MSYHHPMSFKFLNTRQTKNHNQSPPNDESNNHVEAIEAISLMNGEWYNFNSLYAAPRQLSKSSLAAYLDSSKGSGWSIFIVRGNFPEEFPISSADSSNGFGKWLSPEDAERINKSCNSGQQTPQERDVERQQHPNQFGSDEEYDMFSEMDYELFSSDMEDEDLNAAIKASLMDSSPAEANAPHNEDLMRTAFRSSSCISENIS